MSFVDKIVKSSTIPIHYIKCRDINGEDCFYVIMCSVEKLKAILNTEEDINDMAEKGHILASGFGHEIPEETKTILKEKYGYVAD